MEYPPSFAHLQGSGKSCAGSCTLLQPGLGAGDEILPLPPLLQLQQDQDDAAKYASKNIPCLLSRRLVRQKRDLRKGQEGQKMAGRFAHTRKDLQAAGRPCHGHRASEEQGRGAIPPTPPLRPYREEQRCKPNKPRSSRTSKSLTRVGKGLRRAVHL